MIKKRLAREISMQLLFEWEAKGIIEKKNNNNLENIDKIALDKAIKHFASNFYTKYQEKVDFEQTKVWLLGVLENISSIDDLIEKNTTNWQLARLDAIDRAILRLSTFEIAFFKQLQNQIVINEAIEIAKKFGSENSASFVNAVLDAIKS